MPESEQLALFGPMPELTLSASTREPRLWVRRLVLWHDIEDKPFRNVKLERGLNVIWSPSGETAADDQLPSGHAAGKTLFCRALRHCLGESSFASTDDTTSIRAAFPRGAVGAEVVVDGSVWAVRRPFTGSSDIAVRGRTLADLAEEDAVFGFDDYLAALQSTLGDAARLAYYPEPGEHRPWQYILAWLTRDQECRVEGLGSWRHKDTGSRSPVRSSSADARLTVLRLALDVYDIQASARAARIEAATLEVSNAEAAARRAAAERDALVTAVASALGLPPDEVRPPELGDGLWMQNYQREMQEKSVARIASLREPSATAPPHVDDARLASIEGELAELKERLGSERSAVEDLRHERALHADKRPKLERALSESKHPTCPYDGVPLDVDASKAACPLVKFPDPAEVRQELEGLKDRKAEVEAELKHREPKLATLQREHRALQAERDQLARRVKRRQEAEDRAMAAHNQEVAAAWGARSLVEQLLDAIERSTTAWHEHNRLTDSLQELRDEESASRGAQDVSHVSRWFLALVHRVLGKRAGGSIRLDGNGLHADIDQRSVALNSLKVVLFDLAAILCAAEGRAHIPAFLLHDSPREGDLDPSTYRRIFRAIHSMAPDSESAPFQYIITTTSAPPKSMIEEFVRLKPEAVPANKRFLGVDL